MAKTRKISKKKTAKKKSAKTAKSKVAKKKSARRAASKRAKAKVAKRKTAKRKTAKRKTAKRRTAKRRTAPRGLPPRETREDPCQRERDALNRLEEEIKQLELDLDEPKLPPQVIENLQAQLAQKRARRPFLQQQLAQCEAEHGRT
jgi:hypothetical protein